MNHGILFQLRVIHKWIFQEWSESDSSETEEQRSEIVSEKLDSSKTSSTEYGTQSNDETLILDPCRMQSTEPKGYMWLGQNIIPPYWNGAIQKIPESEGYYNVVKDWFVIKNFILFYF